MQISVVRAIIHRTSKGEYVGSKSELAIANLMFSKNIYYKYDDRLYSKGKTEWKLPDFTIKTEDSDTVRASEIGQKWFLLFFEL